MSKRVIVEDAVAQKMTGVLIESAFTAAATRRPSMAGMPRSVITISKVEPFSTDPDNLG